MLKFILNMLIRGMKVGNKYDSMVAKNFSCLPNGYIIKINIYPKNICVFFKYENGKILKLHKDDFVKADLTVEFKDLKSAKRVFLGKQSVAESFCEHRIKVYGNINNAILLTHIINTIECYLFPKFIYGKLFEPIPKLEIGKFKFYFKFLFGGLM